MLTSSTLSRIQGTLPDGTRRETWNGALLLNERVAKISGDCPFLVLLNKRDLDDEWEITEDLLAEADRPGMIIVETSAKTGAGVESAFLRLARMMLAKQSASDES